VLAYTSDTRWRNRAEFLEGRDAIKAFLTRKWQRELDCRLIKVQYCTETPLKIFFQQYHGAAGAARCRQARKPR
jgi:nuclear transport factor 2 (NTF2) superfamily protein